MGVYVAYAFFAIGLLGAEIYAVINKKDGDTISELHWRFAKEHPLIPLAWGVLMGHFFW